MTQEQINEGNKKIAEYVGAKVTTPYPFNKDIGYETYHFEYPMDKDNPTNYPNNKKHHTISGLQYHSSFDWQIPVWSKLLHEPVLITFEDDNIDGLRNTMKIHNFQNRYESSISANSPLDGFKVIIELLEWFNSLKK